MTMTKEEFESKTLKRSTKKNFKVTNSYGVDAAYKYYSKNEGKKSSRIGRLEFMKVISAVNGKIREYVAKGNDLRFPLKMGAILFHKHTSRYEIKNNELTTNQLIDWKSTLDLWYEDPECYKNKQLVRYTSDKRYSVRYCQSMAEFKNRSFYEFHINRGLKNTIKTNIKNHIINDVFI